MQTLLFMALLVTRLKGEPVPDFESFWPLQLRPAGPEHVAGLPLEPGERAFAGDLEVLEGTDLKARVVLVEPGGHLFLDADLDGLLSARERFEFGEVPGVDGPAVLFRFPVNTTGLPYYPVALRPAPVQEGEKRSLLRTDTFYLKGTIDVAGRPVLVRYPVYPFTGEVDLKKGTLGMDLDGDGEIEPGLSAGETDRDRGRGVVFPLIGMAVSTTRVDAAAGLAELRIHPASDVRGFDLRPGSLVPDFEFTDVDGRPRRLSELRGQVVLLDFWGTWCVPCRQELPVLRKAFAAYKDRGFTILGMDARDELARLQAFVAEQDVPWIHATAQSVEAVIRDGFRVRGYPTKILLDREGRVISAGDDGQPLLEGEALLKTAEAAVATGELVSELKAEPVLDANSRRMVLEGTIKIGFMEMLVRYPLDPRTGQVDLKGRIGMDVDEDGIIETALTAGELKGDVGDGPRIFRIHDDYISTASFDSATGKIVLRRHSASDYQEYDLRPGAEIPDFAFTDLEGKERRFSEFRGKVVLLDFWSTTCGPCMAEMPVLRKIQQDLGSRGFVILGMDIEDDLETHKKWVAEMDLSWVHATSASVQDIILKRFGVVNFPTHILVDREGRIVSVGDQLAATVEEVVSRKPVVEYAGRLGTEALPQVGSGMPVKLEPATPEALPVPPAPGDSVYAGRMRVLRRNPLEAQIVLVQPAEGTPFVYADTDLDGKLSVAERYELGDYPDLMKDWRAALVRFPMKGGAVDLYPVLLSLNPVVSALPRDQPRSLLRSTVAYLEGTVPVEGREIKVRYPMGSEVPDVSLQGGELGMDLDGDGRFARGISSLENQQPMEDGQPVIFRLGDLYLSTKSVDAASGRIVLRTHAPAEYRRFDLSPGSRLPDFEFTDPE
ncbi:MAG TPA: TlpA disulfide reductase family protein, partial [Thermoanaerobaculia bacterium]|nr:TlpA disulfide reductase family protein [Thermoanaerobaculia bacterium]